jgi:peptidoglycan hydrolase FlgJ
MKTGNDMMMLPPERSGNMEAAAGHMARLQKQAAKDPVQIKKAAQEFESVFISQMLGHMFVSVGNDEMFGGGEAEDIYRSMMIDEYGKLMAKSGGIGIADQVTRELLQNQEVKK